jgi:hypothetical protein
MHTPGAPRGLERSTPPSTDDEGPNGEREPPAPEDIRPIKRSSTLKDGSVKRSPNGDIEEPSEDEYDADDAEDAGDWVKPKFDEIIAKVSVPTADLDVLAYHSCDSQLCIIRVNRYLSQKYRG